MEEGAPSSCRPPWLETTIAEAPVPAASLASSTSRMPLMMSLPGQQTPDPFDVFPGERLVELGVGPFRERGHVLEPLHVPREIPERPALASEHREHPAGPDSHVDGASGGEPRRNGEAVPDVAVALAQHLQVDGEHEGAAPGRRGALDQSLHETAITHDIELEPERLFRRFRHLLDRADRHGAEGKRYAGLLCGLAGEDFAVAVHEADQGDGRQRQRQRHGLTEYRRRPSAAARHRPAPAAGA